MPNLRRDPNVVPKVSTARGCPKCGSHDTAGITAKAAQWCNTCNHKWLPCAPYCRGYEVSTEGIYPAVYGCKGCGVPDHIARWWPEAYRTLNKLLVEKFDKFAPIKTPRADAEVG